MNFEKIILPIVVFVCGAVVLIFEITGSRILGPYYGTSVFVWTTIIGIILASLSIGYYFGGILADKNVSVKRLALIILGSGILMIITNVFKDIVLLIGEIDGFGNFSLITSTIILFSPISVLLGAVSPYAFKLSLKDINNAGSISGKLSAISTFGSIFGTFFAGFYMIPTFGTNKILGILSAILIGMSLILLNRKNLQPTIVSVLVFVLFISNFNYSLGKENFIDVDTTFNRVWIYDFVHEKTQRPARIMGINNENHSAMFLDGEDLVYEYTKHYDLAKHFNPNFQKTLILGGAGYSYPKYFLKNYPDATMDVVEIDPMMTELAKKYFNLKDDPRMRIFHQDGRVFMNQTDEKYDVIFGDAYGSRYSVPYQLTTIEAAKKQYEMLNDDGILVLNIISALEGDSSKFFKAEYKTYKEVFPQIYVFRTDEFDVEDVQNLIFVVTKSDKEFSLESDDPVMNSYLEKIYLEKIETDLPILTDDYAPVEYYAKFNL